MKTKKVTEEAYREALDLDMGWCPSCADFTREMTEPDAEGYDCPICDGDEVVGAELALVTGAIDIKEPAGRRCMSSREARSALKQHETPCTDCPWRRTSIPGWLGSVTVDAWIAAAHGEVRIDCHSLIGAQCAGAATYRANVYKKPRDQSLLRLAADRVAVFSRPDEFKAHHAAGPIRKDGEKS